MTQPGWGREQAKTVIPAKAGIQVVNPLLKGSSFLDGKSTAWIPAFAGMTVFQDEV